MTFQHSPVGMAIVHLDGTWARVNDSMCTMLGRSASELLDLTFQDITHPDDLAADLELLQECLDGRRHGYRMTKRYLHREGHVVWGDLSVALVRDDAGDPLYFVSQVLDVSEHRAVQERLERFAALVSHDLKTPLTAVRASLELLGELVGGPQPDLASARLLAEQAEASAQRMGALVDALLAVASAAAPEPEVVSLRAVVDAAVADLGALIARAGASVRTTAGLDHAPRVVGSADLLRTLLVNLLTNAVKFRDPDRRLHVEIDTAPREGEPQTLEVRVRNDGPSIPDEERERVFEFLARGGRHDGVAGFGIGLTACRRIVELHGGQIWIEEPDGGGVEVRLTLPVVAQTSAGSSS
nr:sensor histidine kinase [Nocardioides flavescens]